LGRYFKAKIIHNLHLNTTSGLLTFYPLEPVNDPKPGQFYLIEVGSSYDPLLKRPFSFFRKTSEGIQFLYTVRGKGTALMRDLKQGEVIHILGPLGSGYPEPGNGELPLLVAGGIGIASIFSLVESLAKKAQVFYGARNKNELLIIDEVKGLTGVLTVSTDDGSMGEKGTVVDVLSDFLTHHSLLNTRYLLYACGPRQMLEALSGVAIEKGLKGYISVEENMACGVGACLGCAVKTNGGYKMVCSEGPVFPIEEIIW
jgi:dihydroorotate dehydrogenase electron transfer subunit